ncbi:MAG: BatD family protein, partial [Candidatus Krumholzibacteria bacterium]|nr:BatD family protein [Candidatus Krumholzibacteria bacterium]
LDDFFNRRMRNFGFGKPKTLTTHEMPITVLPLPHGGKPANFSGLVGSKMTVSLRTDKQVVEAGDPVNVTVEIAGKGNFKTMAAPEIPPMAGFKMYESSATSELFKNEYVVSGRKRIEFVLIPQVEGPTVIPPIQISYFDPSVREYKTIQSAPVQMSVKPATTERGRQVVFTGSGEDIEVLGRDIHFIRPVPAEISIGGASVYRGGVVAALHVVPLLAVVMSLVVERRRRRWMNDAPLYRAQRAARDARKRLRQADRLLRDGRTEEAFTAIASAVRGYLADKMDKSPSGVTIDEINDFLRRRDVRDEDMAQVTSVLTACDGAQYSAAAGSADHARQTRIRAAEMIDTLEKRYG